MYTYRAIVTRILDGDTFDCDIDVGFKLFTKQRVRLRGIDAPEVLRTTEIQKKAGLVVRKFLIPLENKEIIVRTHKARQFDMYGRYLADVFLYDGELWLNDYLLKLRYAKCYDKIRPNWSIDELRFIISNPKKLKFNT